MPSSPYEADKDVVSFDRFLGLRNNVGAESFGPGDLDAALNVDITDELRVQRRNGHGDPILVGDYHSLWSDGNTALVVSGTTLYEITPTLAIRIVRTGLTAGRRMYYSSLTARVFYSNDVETGVFQNSASRTWGIVPPAHQPTASVMGGDLRAGRYQFAVTYLRTDGQESGTGHAGLIELTTPSGIAFTDIPVSSDPDVSFKCIYISPVDGGLMYRLLTLPNAATVASYSTERIGTIPLKTQFLTAAPAGRHVAVLGAHSLVADRNFLRYSEPYAMELFDPRRTVTTEKRITLVAPMENGLYLGTESEVVWLDGLDPVKWTFRRVAAYGAIPGTLAYTEAANIGEAGDGVAMMVASTRGLCVGLPGGTFRNVTRERFNYPVQDEGAGIVRENGGSIQYLVTMKGTERSANTAR